MGQLIAHYRLVRKLGEGGMGVVWKAYDTTLQRTVALKFLPEALVADSARLGRLEREARLLASLNHSNIAVVHGFHQAGGERFLAMEFVEGQSLAEQLAEGPLSMGTALDVSRQIAEALEDAHERGVIHRDLKPANIMITDAGRVKVLDFGLAKALAPAQQEIGDETTQSLEQRTREGSVLGTPAYMSPEQVHGRAVDRRTDIWAFGCALYEMLIGRPAFRGETLTDTLASILRSEPDLSLLPPGTPRTAARLIDRCLQKDPRRRLQAMGEARIAIEEYQADTAQDTPASIGSTGTGRPWLPWVLLGIMTLSAILTTGLYLSEHTQRRLSRGSLPPHSVRFELQAHYILWSADENAVSLSPQGDAIAYISQSAHYQPPMLWVRDFDDPEPRLIPGTEEAVNPFWSPDGRSLGYDQKGAIRVIDRDGGPSRLLHASEQSFGPPSWAGDGSLLLAPMPLGSKRIVRVPTEGGTAVPVSPPMADGEIGHAFPQWLPDGRHFLYVSLSATADRPSLHLVSIGGGEARQVPGVHSRAEYAGGKLYYWEDGTVVSRPFDPERAAFIGDPAPVCETTGSHQARTGMAVFTVADRGNTVACGQRTQTVEVRWFDRSGQDHGPLGGSNMFEAPRISPDGHLVAVEQEDPRTGSDDIWIFDLVRDVPTRLVGGPADDDSPAWSPDGERLAYTSDIAGPPRIFILRADGVGKAMEVRIDEGLPSYVVDWSPDGRSILYRAFADDADLHLAVVDGTRPSRLFAGGPGNQWDGRFSPDGRWVALASTELGQGEVFVAPLADGAALRRVSPAGGTGMAWSRDGKEIYYATGSTMYTVSFSSQNGVIGPPRELFSLDERFEIGGFDVAPAGDRFLIGFQDLEQSRSSITVVLNPLAP